MDPTSGIERLGFRKWYERELIKCHAALVTCFLSALLAAALMEQLDKLELGWEPASLLIVVFGAIILGWTSWRSYITILRRAELYGQRSNCPQCHAYARFKVVATGTDTIPGPIANAVAPLGAAWLRVECRKCGAVWRMPD